MNNRRDRDVGEMGANEMNKRIKKDGVFIRGEV